MDATGGKLDPVEFSGLAGVSAASEEFESGPMGAIVSTAWMPATWMWDLREYIGHKPLSCVRMLGSHDSATYNITWKSAVAPDAPGELKKRSKGGFGSEKIRKVTAAWAQTQSMTILQQLLAGVRYLDIRLVPNPDDNNSVWVSHSLFSVPLRDVVADVLAYLSTTENCREVIVFDIQRLIDPFSMEHWPRLVADMSPLAQHFVSRPAGFSSTMNDLWKDGAGHNNVLVLLPDSFYHDSLPWTHHRSTSLDSPWPDVNETNALIRELKSISKKHAKTLVDSFDESSPLTHCQHCPHSPLSSQTSMDSPSTPAAPVPRLCVMQGVLTPKGGDIARGVLSPFSSTSSSISDFAQRTNAKVMAHFRDINLIPLLRKKMLAAVVRDKASRQASEDNNMSLVSPCLCQFNSMCNILMLDYLEIGVVPLGNALLDNGTRNIRVGAAQLCVYLNIVCSEELLNQHEDSLAETPTSRGCSEARV